MSYRQELRAAELAVIEAAMRVWSAGDQLPTVNQLTRMPSFEGPWTVRHEHFQPLHDAIMGLHRLRSQIDAPVTPSSDDDTSANAARAALPMVGGLRRKIVYEVYRRRNHPIPGATDDQLERALNRKHTSVSAARNFLVDAGWLHDSGQRTPTQSGRPAVMWVLTDFGEASVVRLALSQGPPE